MSRQHPSRSWRSSRELYWFSFIPLSAFLVKSFLGARHLYLDRCEHPSTSQFTAVLLALMLWTSFLTIHVFAGVLRARKGGESDDAPGR